MLSLHLTPIFKARGIDKPYSYLVKSGFTNSAAHSILHGLPRVLRLDHIERLCRILVCEPSDLLAYTPSKDQPLFPEHPLNNLKHTPEATSIQDTIATMPFKQLKEITRKLTGES